MMILGSWPRRCEHPCRELEGYGRLWAALDWEERNQRRRADCWRAMGWRNFQVESRQTGPAASF